MIDGKDDDSSLYGERVIRSIEKEEDMFVDKEETHAGGRILLIC